jgi:tetratricopeptide (TPR) repeat protein
MPQSAEGAAGPPSRVDAEAGDASPSQRLLPGAYLGALPSVPLVERQEELGRLTAGINAAMEGRGRLMLLVGEPGVGKTRLAQEATAILQERGVMIATGRCYEPEQSVPYYPFLDVLADIARQIQGELQEQIPYRWPYLLRLLPELQPLGAALPSSSLEPSRTGTAAVFLPAVSGDEPLIIRAVAGFLDAVAAGTPLAILLDDLHWSDSATVKLLLHLARHSGGRPIFLLGTYRDLDVTPDHPLHGALIDLGRERLMEKIMLRRLDLRGTEALIAQTLDGGVLPPGLVEIVHEPADGNPFFVGEIVRSMMEEGTLFRKNGTWGRRQRSEIHVPESVRAVLGQRLARLTDGTRTVLHAASVLGQTFRFDEVEGVSGLSEEEVEEALDEAAGAGLLREMDPDVFAFSHALVQGAVYEDLTARRQRRLHLTAAEIIEAGPERERRCGEIASHFLRAGDTARAIPYWILAGDAAQGVFAYAEAEQHYRAALEAAHTTADTAQEAAALERLGTTLLRQAQYAEALECVRAAAHAYRSLEDREGELRAGCLLGEVLQIQGKHREAFATLLALRVSPDDSSASPGMVQMHLRLSEIAMDLKEYEQQEELVVQALRIAETLGDRRLLVRANLYLQGALWYRGRPNDVFTALKEYVRLLEGESDLVELFRFTHILALMAMLRGDLQASREYSERALDLARRVGDPLAIPNALHQLASALFLLGDWPVARMHLESARALAQSIDAATPLLYILSSLGHLTVCEGDWDAGEELLQEAGKVVQETDVRDSNLMQHQFLANLDLLRGHPQKAVQRLTPLLERSSDEEMWSTPLVPLLACAYLGLGDIDRAEMFVRDSLRRAERDSNRLDLVQGLFALAGVREKEGRADEARAALQDALRHARDMSFPAAQAEALFRLGSLELECGDSGAARTSLTSAREIWERLGARKDLERVDEALQGSRSAGV